MKTTTVINNLIAGIIGFFILPFDTFAAIPETNGNIYKTISAVASDSLMKANENNPDFVVLDVRTPTEWKADHIMGSINRNYFDADFTAQLNALPKHKIFLLHCQSGSRSAATLSLMKNLNFFEVYEMSGGMNAWKMNSLPTTSIFAPRLMLVSNGGIKKGSIHYGMADTFKITVTNRANDTLRFTSFTLPPGNEFLTDFDLNKKLSGAEDYTFSVFYDPQQLYKDSVDVEIRSNGGDLGLSIIIIKEILQEITLNTGWNIFSASVIPGNPDMKTLFQSLIDDGSLVKVQDETGNSLEDYGILGGWTNNIGSIALTEGYKVKVKDTSRLIVTGVQASLPFDILLKAGWNIMGYPYSAGLDGMKVVQSLIDRGTLVKVQDDSGNAIEDYGILGGWTNNIGDFKPGEGYKIKVTANEILTIPDLTPIALLDEKTDTVGICYLKLDTLDIVIKFQALDTLSQPLANVNVRCHRLKDYVIIYVNESMPEPWFKIYTYDELIALQSEEILKSTAQPTFAVTTIIVAGLIIWSVYDFVKEMVTDPPHIEEIPSDGNLVKKCIVGDWNDVISTLGLIGAVGNVFKVVHVLGAPAKIRGVTAINLGFTFEKLTDETGIQLAEEVFSEYGPLDKEHTTICWYEENNGGTGSAIPILYVEDKSDLKGTLTDSRDGNIYDWVRIGNQFWMAENLAYLPSVSPPSFVSSSDPFYYVYDYNGYDGSVAKTKNNYKTYGVLYNLPAAIHACPVGWHVPSAEEWEILFKILGVESSREGGILKETGTTHWLEPNIGATNLSGFTGLPGGWMNYPGFSNIGERSFWWSTSETVPGNGYYRSWSVYYNWNAIGGNGLPPYFGHSVRCLRD